MNDNKEHELNPSVIRAKEAALLNRRLNPTIEDKLWDLFIEVAKPTKEFADTAEDNKEAIIKALDAVYTLGWNDSMR
jgi:hypothetical protein